MNKKNSFFEEFNPIFSIENYEKIDKNFEDFKGYNINEIISIHNLGSKLNEDYIRDIVEFREYRFLSYPDNIYLLGFRVFIEAKFNHFKGNIEHLLEFLNYILKPLVQKDSQSQFIDKICHKELGIPFNMLFIENVRIFFEKMQDFEEFMGFIQDSLNFKERRICEVLLKILCFEEYEKIIEKKVEVSQEFLEKKTKFEEFLLSGKNSVLDLETKYIIQTICSLSFIEVEIHTYDSDRDFVIYESFPFGKSPLKFKENEKNRKKIVIFNDSKFRIYVLDRISMNLSAKLEEELDGKLNVKEKFEEKVEEKLEEKHLKKPSDFLPNLPSKSLCVSCSSFFLLDDYNHYSVYFLNKCEQCHKTICSVHKDDPLKCACFCRKCKGKTEKRYHFKRSSDFGFADDCYELIECKKCNIIQCSHCKRIMRTYEDVCDCQCEVCAKKILNEFEEFEDGKKTRKCLDCSLICKKCMIRKGDMGFLLYLCEICGNRYCRSCFNEVFSKEKKEKNDKIQKKTAQREIKRNTLDKIFN